MSLGERLKGAVTDLAAKWLGKEWGGAVFIPHGNFSNFWSGLGGRYDSALALSAVYACVRIISQDMAKMSLGTYQRREDGSIGFATNHPLNRVFRRPNTWQTSFQWVQTKLVDILLHGNSFDRVVWAGNGWPIGLVSYRPHQVQVYQDKKDGEVFYRLAGEPERLPSIDVLHLRGLSADGVMGLSPIRAAARSIELGLTLEQHGLNLFKRGARPGGVVTTKKALGKDAKLNLKRQIEAFVGGSNSGGIAVFEEDSSFTPLAMTSTDAEFLVNRRFQLEEVCRIYGVPLHRVAEMVKATYNNAEMVSADYINNTLMAYAENIEASLDRWLLLDSVEYFTQFDTSALLRADQASRYKSYSIGIGTGFLNPNEVRRMEGRYSPEPLPPYDLGNRFYVPSNTVPVELAGQQQTAGNGGDGDKPDDDDEAKRLAGAEEEDEG